MKPLFPTIAFLFCATAGQADPMTFRIAGNGGNCEECQWIAAEGEITSDTPDALVSFLEDHRARLIVFDSPGGDLGAALRMGRMLRDLGKSTGVGRTEKDQFGSFSTVTDGRCESACAFAYMGGQSRRIDAADANEFVPLPGRLGMHRFYTLTGTEIPSAETQQIMGQLLIYIQDMDVDPRVLSLASAASETEMYHFSQDELSEFRLVTTRSQSDAVPLIVEGGLAVEWSVYDDAREVERSIRLHCTGTAENWVMTVIPRNVVPPAGEEPETPGERLYAAFANDGSMFNDVHVRIGGTRFDMTTDDILAEETDSRDLRLEVRLPVDVRSHPGEPYRFVTTRLRMAVGQYWAGGTLPDANALAVLSRSCVAE